MIKEGLRALCSHILQESGRQADEHFLENHSICLVFIPTTLDDGVVTERVIEG